MFGDEFELQTYNSYIRLNILVGHILLRCDHKTSVWGSECIV